MRKIEEVKIGDNGVPIVVHELTVTQVEEQLTAIETQVEPTALDWLFADEYMNQSLLEAIIEQPLAPIIEKEKLTPSELVPLYEKAVEVNPFLAGALTKMRKISDLMIQLETNPLDPSRGLESVQSILQKEAT